jgi:hypothetical protein
LKGFAERFSVFLEQLIEPGGVFLADTRMNKVLPLLPLLIVSCNTLSDESESFSKEYQTIETPPPPREESPVRKTESHAVETKPVITPLPDPEEVGVVACEYVITNVLGKVQDGLCVHVDLNDKQRQSLKARLPKRDIRTLSDASKKLCNRIKVDQVKIAGSVAGAEATWVFDRTFMTYAIYLSKTSNWTVTNAWVLRGSIAD